jgi:cell division septation protein DedD
MFLRAAIVSLLVLNLGVAAWWIAGANVPRPAGPAPMPAGVPSLRLVGEATGVAPADAAPAAPAAQDGALVAEAAVAAPPAVVEQCLRFGPFADAPARDAARTALSAAGLPTQPRETPARSGRGWKVHLPPLASREEAKAMGERIKAAGISDWYVLNEGADANSIALGRYGSEEAARRREAELKAKGFAAQAAPLGDTAAQSWLDGRLPATAKRSALMAIAPSKSVDCATLR